MGCPGECCLKPVISGPKSKPLSPPQRSAVMPLMRVVEVGIQGGESDLIESRGTEACVAVGAVDVVIAGLA